jgi:hypothetical protein
MNTPTEYPSETTDDFAPIFAPIVWDDQPYSAFSLGIDWERVFPPSSDTQYGITDEPVVSFSAPMWT